jgi:hypothetical protein
VGANQRLYVDHSDILDGCNNHVHRLKSCERFDL